MPPSNPRGLRGALYFRLTTSLIRITAIKAPSARDRETGNIRAASGLCTGIMKKLSDRPERKIHREIELRAISRGELVPGKEEAERPGTVPSGQKVNEFRPSWFFVGVASRGCRSVSSERGRADYSMVNVGVTRACKARGRVTPARIEVQ